MKEAVPLPGKDGKAKGKKGEGKKMPSSKISKEVSYSNLFKDHAVGGAPTTGRDIMKRRTSASGDLAVA